MERFTLTDLSKLPDPGEAYYAKAYHKRLVEMINEFDAELDSDHEVGIRLVSFGKEMTFHIREIGYYNPSLIRFFGETSNGEGVELIQHVNQINVLLMAAKRLHPEQPKKPMGFTVE